MSFDISLTDKVIFVNDRLELDAGNAHTVIEPWGKDSFRVRTTPARSVQKSDWALDIPQEHRDCIGGVSEGLAYIRNGAIEARVERTRTQDCRISFYRITERGEQLLLAEKDYIVYANLNESRFFRPVDEELYHAELHLEAMEGERLFGMGENETNTVDLKGCVIELYQRHIKAPIPFVLSSRGYGFLWNNPSLGRVEFANNMTRWVS